MIAHKSASTRGELLVQPEAYREFQQQAKLNDDAAGMLDLYPGGERCSHKVLKCPSQQEGRLSVLRAAFKFAHEERTRSLRRSEHAERRRTRQTKPSEQQMHADDDSDDEGSGELRAKMQSV